VIAITLFIQLQKQKDLEPVQNYVFIFKQLLFLKNTFEGVLMF